MRILVVSAHYPPDFVSGGTLQPQRMARALRERGHEVSVFAGWLGEVEPLEEWTEADETGMSVHWIATRPWIGWDDERNWHNPEVTERFRAHLRDIRPDVVHFHSLQSLGAGLLPAAKASGARVAVTMHDFWWLCSRQFLVDRDEHPCSLVVDAGTCPCEVDRSWRERRGDALRVMLRSADLVLAPSASAAAVLAANGLAESALVVDENGMPDEVVHRLGRSAPAGTPARADRAVRFLYTGGPNPMKGVRTLLEAFAGLPDDGRWTLSAHGVGEYLELAEVDVSERPVHVLAAYDPSELGERLAVHDVLVLPSVMRETYSLVTREALLAGVPVVCTDTLGPEEVVRDGVNGLVVPAGDAESLRAAVASLLDHPELLDRLRDGTRGSVSVRSIDEQVGVLEGRLEAIGRPTGAAPPRSVRRVLFVCGIEGAPLRYRARLPAEAMALRGIRSDVVHYRSPEVMSLAAGADVVVMYRVPATVQVLEAIEAIRGGGTPVLFDVDDLIFDPDIAAEIPALRLLPPDEAALWLQGVHRYRTTLEACDGYVGSTEMLVEHAATVTGLPSRRFDNGVGVVLARHSDAALRAPRTDGPVRLAYFSGTTTHDEDWFSVETVVARCLEAHPTAELWLGGHLPATPALERFGDRVVRLPFLPWTELPHRLRDVDVNLAPLAAGIRFNEAKSAIKWLEAALCATPTIASPTGPFVDAVGDDEHGLLAGDEASWEAALDRLVGDVAERRRLGQRARRRALLEWSPWRQGRRYEQILVEALERGPELARRSSWDPVALDEPPVPVELEPYPGPGGEPGGPDPQAVPGEAPVAGPPVRRAARSVRRRLGAARLAWHDAVPAPE